MSTVHSVAHVGFGVGTNEHYDRSRPSYQAPAISFIRNAVSGKAPLNIVELGSGTGLFTRALLAHPEWSSSVNVLKAFEPSEGMRQVFSDKTKDPRVSIAEGFFDHVPVEDHWADVIIIAQAFHWCPDYEKAAREFNRVLKPNGTLAMIWNLEDRDAAGWVAQLRDLIEIHEDGSPQFRLGLWRQLYDAPSFKQHFTTAQETSWNYVLDSTTELAIDRALSKSYTVVLPDEKKKEISDKIKGFVEEGQGLVRKNGSVFEYPYKTFVVTATRK